MQRFIIIIITIISGLHYFLCTGKWSSRTISFGVTSAGREASSTLHYPMPGTLASPCRPALTVLCHHFGVPSSLLRHLGSGSGIEPCPASSSDRVINTEHINQLSCLHAQSFKFLTCVRLDQALYFFGKKLLVKISLSKLCLWRANSNTPFTWGFPSWSFFLLHMVILVRLRSLFVYYATIYTILT